jgi:hypothetical protein
MARLSEDYAKLFHYEGAKTDKHVREHEVYAISSEIGSLRRTLPVPPPRQAMRLPGLPKFLKLGAQRWSQALEVNSKLLVVAPLAFTLIVGTGVIARGHRDDDARATPAAQAPRVALAPKVEAAPARPAPAEPPAEAPKASAGELPAAKDHKAPPKAKDSAPKAGSSQTARAGEAEAAAPSVQKAPETVAIAAPSPREGTINIIALPWAEVFVDGTRQGVSPPLKAIPLRAGKHRVELRNGSFPPHVQTVELRPGAEINITHRFRR